MSDDTPTQKYDPVGSDAPTEVFGGPPTPPAGTNPPAPGEGKSRRLVIILASIGGALLVAVLILLILLLTRGAPAPVTTPSASPTPTPTPTASETPTPSPTPTPTPTETTPPPPPPPAGPITSYTASQTTVDCSGDNPTVTFSWAATGQTLWFGVGTDNAKNAPYDTYPLNYTLDFTYQCGQASGQQKYTITVESSTGDVTSKTIVIRE